MEKPEPQYIKPIGIPRLKHRVVSPRVMMRTNLAQLMYEIAEDHKELAKKVTGRDTSKDMPVEIKESMIGIIFAYTCLEAYINVMGKDQFGGGWQSYENANIVSKWKGLTNYLMKRETGKIRDIYGTKLLNALESLRLLRHDLVHWKAEFLDIVETKYGRTEGLIESVSFEKAEWACNIMQRMISKFHNGTDIPRPSWFN
jgi:hypothetical protein